MSRNDKNKQHLARQFPGKQQTFYIFEEQQLIKEAQYQKMDIRGHYIFGMDNTSLATVSLDAQAATNLLREFGLKGEAYPKGGPYGQRYIIFKGYPGERKFITGTRYLQSNPKIVNMAIGKLGVHKSVIQGASIAIVMYVGINLLEYFLNDEGTAARIFGTLATDITKVVVSGMMGALAGGTIATTMSLVFLPIIIAVGVTIATGWVLNLVDQNYQLTEKLVKAIEQTGNNIEDGFFKFFSDLEAELEWRIENGIPF